MAYLNLSLEPFGRLRGAGATRQQALIAILALAFMSNTLALKWIDDARAKKWDSIGTVASLALIAGVLLWLSFVGLSCCVFGALAPHVK